jgi:CRISP-associated protein Cas1
MLPMIDMSLWEDVTPDDSLVIADGRSVTIGVRDKALVIKDGPRGERTRTYVLPKRARRIKHLLILGGHGYVSLEAVKWLADASITWVAMDPSGITIRETTMPRMVGCSGGFEDPMMARRQAYCYTGGPLQARGVAIIQRFTETKLRAQAAVAERRFGNEDIAQYIRGLLPRVAEMDNTEALRGVEGDAGRAYWSAWKGLAPEWMKPSPLKGHWLEYPGRPSLNYTTDDGNNRNATDPVNAMLNFGYKLLETHATLALHRQSLSPAMGISHVDLKDRRRRNAMALDLMEGARPAVDEVVLDLISQPLDRRLFSEDRRGVVTVEAPLTHELATRIHANAYRLEPDLLAMVRVLMVPLDD